MDGRGGHHDGLARTRIRTRLTALAAVVALVAIGFVLAGTWPGGAGALRVPDRPSPGCAHTEPAEADQTDGFHADNESGSYVEQFPTWRSRESRCLSSSTFMAIKNPDSFR